MSHGPNDPIHAARELLGLDPVFLDCETTGLQGQICEIAILDREGKTLLDTLVKPTWKMEEDARLVHRITDEMLASAPAFAEVWDQIEGLLLGRHIVIYNSLFDTGCIIRSAFDAEHQPTLLHPRVSALIRHALGRHIHCAMELFAEFYGDWSSYRRSYRYKALDFAAQHFHLDVVQDHRAHGDAEMCRQIVKALAAQVILTEDKLYG